MGARVTVIAVGKLRNTEIRSLCDDFSRKIGRYCAFEQVELKDVKRARASSDVRELEAQNILSKLPKSSFVIALDERGLQKSTRDIASWFEKIEQRIGGHICFIVGGPDGLHEQVTKASNAILSLSLMTMTHELARLVLFEQIYRVFSLRAGHPYHRT